MTWPWEGKSGYLWRSEPDHQAQRLAAEAAEAEKRREGIMKGLRFIENRAREPRTASFFKEKCRASLEELEEKCKSAS